MVNRQKGQDYERETCKKLSKWWSDGEYDDLYWRTHGSGARATVRHKSGRTTRGQYGDVCATQPEAQPLLDVLTLSLKKGYTSLSVQDLFDVPHGNLTHEFRGFILEAERNRKQAGTPYWMIIWSRVRRKELIFASSNFFREFTQTKPLASVYFRYKKERIYFGIDTMKRFYKLKPKQFIKFAKVP